jgi:hypothetical protein
VTVQLSTAVKHLNITPRAKKKVLHSSTTNSEIQPLSSAATIILLKQKYFSRNEGFGFACDITFRFLYFVDRAS